MTFAHGVARELIMMLAMALVLTLSGCGGKQEREAAYLARGKQLFEQGLYVKAALEFRNALQINPTEVESQFYLGLIAEQTGDAAGALNAFTRVSEQDPKNVKAQLKLGQYALLQGDQDKVLEKANLVLSLDSGNADAFALRASSLLRQGKLDLAEAEAKKAQQADPDNVAAVSVLAGIKVKQGDTDGALKLLDEGIKRSHGEDGLRLVVLKILTDRNDLAGSETVLRDLVASRPANNAYKVSLAKLLVSEGKKDEAEKVFRDAIARKPDDKDLNLLLVQFLAQQRGAMAAEQELQAISTRNPDEQAYRFALAELYARDGKKDQAKTVLQAIIDKAKSGPEALTAKTGLARLALANGDSATAESLIAEVLKDDGENADALLIRAGISMDARNYQAAILDLRTILRDNPVAKLALLMLAQAYAQSGEEQLVLDSYRKYLDVDPANTEVRVELARRLMQAGNLDEAEKQVDLILEISPTYLPALLARVDQKVARKDWSDAEGTATSIIRIAGSEAVGHGALGKVLLAEGKLPQAIGELEQAASASPGPSEARHMLVQAYMDAGKAPDAEQMLQAAIAKDAKDADAWVLLADVRYIAKQAGEAEKALRQAIAIDPTGNLPYVKLGDLYIKTARMADAAETFRLALQRIPNEPQFLLRLGMAEDALNRVEAARDAYEAVLKLQPRNRIAANNLAVLIADAWPADKDRMEEARRLAEAFRNSNEPILLDTLGWVQFRLGNIEDAVALLERAALAMPDEPQIAYHLGMAYKARGDDAKAREALQKAVASSGGYRGFDDAKQILASM